MEKGTLACAVLIFVLVGKQEVVSLTIKKCVKRRQNVNPATYENFVDIDQNKNNTIICDGVYPSDTVVWSITRTSVSTSTVAMCNSSSCTVQADPAYVAAERNLTQSQLFYYQHDFAGDTDAKISCESTHAGTFSSASCTLNVISEVSMSNCFVRQGIYVAAIIVAGCEYSGFQSSGNVVPECQFFQRNAMGETKFDAVVRMRQSECSLSRTVKNWQPCKYNYSVLFWPGLPEEVIIDDDQCNRTAIPATTTTATTTTATTTTATTTTTTATTTIQTTTMTVASAPANQPKRISLTTSVGNAGSAIVLQRGQKNVHMTCRYDSITRTAGILGWCKTGECPQGNRMCNPTCSENIGLEEVTQSCAGSQPCGMTLTVKKVRDCDGGTYSCFVFSAVNVSKYDTASVVVSVQDCKKNTYGPECSDKCGRCAGNQTCNTITGNCLACLDGWVPPLCTEEEPLLTPKQKVVVGVAVGAPLTWGFVATIIQVYQVLGNAGWLPFLPMGGKQEEKEEKDDDDDESDEEEPPTKCSRFLKCIFCGGAGMCLVSFLFCISCGKVMSKKFIWRKDKDIQDAESNREHPAPPSEETQPSLPPEETQPSLPPEEEEAKSSDYAETKPSEPEPDNPEEQQPAVIEQPKTASFTERYFATASWLDNPHKDMSQGKSKSYLLFSSTNLHGYYSSHSDVHIKLSENKRDDDTNKSDQQVNDEEGGAAENVVSETGEATKEMMLGQK